MVLNRLFLAILMALSLSCADNHSGDKEWYFYPIFPYLIENVQWEFLEEGERIGPYYKKDGAVFCGEQRSPKLEHADMPTFEVFGQTGYAKDKSRVYYPIEIPCIDYSTYGVCYCAEYIVEAADPETFEYLGQDYATDGEDVFFRGKRIPGAESASIDLIEGPKYLFSVKDKNQVYLYDRVLEEADPASFQYWKTSQEGVEKEYLLRDSLHVWSFKPPGQVKLIESLTDVES